MRTTEAFRKTGWFRKEYTLTVTALLEELSGEAAVNEICAEVERWRNQRGSKATHLAILAQCERLPSEDEQEQLRTRLRGVLRDVAQGLRWMLQFIDAEKKWLDNLKLSPERAAAIVTGKGGLRPS